MNRFEIRKAPLPEKVGHSPLEEPAKIKAAMQKTPGSSPIVYAD
jgi:hypothetical protein